MGASGCMLGLTHGRNWDFQYSLCN
jgi:hypothetical protein